MLSLDAVEASYGRSQVLFGVNLAIRQGEVVTLLGRNGMGKSTTVRAITGLLPPTSGKIQFEGARIERWPSYRICQDGIALVPEGRQIFPNLTVRENLICNGVKRKRENTSWTLERVFDLFPRLKERIGYYGNRLSGGEQQMLAIGRALMTNPKLLILDEATEGLAPLVRDEIWKCVETLKRENLSILLIDKNLDHILEIADRHYVIEKGRIVWEGDTPSFRHDTTITKQYLEIPS